MSDNLFSFLFFLAFYLFVVRKFYSSAFVLGLAALTRPIGLFLAPLFLAASAVLYYLNLRKLMALICLRQRRRRVTPETPPLFLLMIFRTSLFIKVRPKNLFWSARGNI